MILNQTSSVVYPRQVRTCDLAGLELLERADCALLVAEAAWAYGLVGLGWYVLEVRQVAVAYVRCSVVLGDAARVIVAAVDCPQHFGCHPFVGSERLASAIWDLTKAKVCSRPTRW